MFEVGSGFEGVSSFLSSSFSSGLLEESRPRNEVKETGVMSFFSVSSFESFSSVEDANFLKKESSSAGEEDAVSSFFSSFSGSLVSFSFSGSSFFSSSFSRTTGAFIGEEG